LPRAAEAKRSNQPRGQKKKAMQGCGPAWPWFFCVAPGISRCAAWLVVYFDCIEELNSIKRIFTESMQKGIIVTQVDPDIDFPQESC